jgi:hypothetical protein
MSETEKPVTTPPATSPTEQAGQQTYDWTKLATAAATAIAGLLGTSYGIWVALGAAVVALIGFLLLRVWWKNYQFESAKTRAGEKAGQEASDDQQKLNNNRDAVDDFLGRDHRS